MRKFHLLGGAVGVLALSACGDLLDVKNQNQPDVARAYATVDGVEGVIGGLGSGLYNGNGQRSNEGTNTQSKILAGESMTSVNNFGGAPRSAIPRGPISNSLGNDIQAGNRVLFQNFSVLARTAANAIAAVERLAAPPGVGLGNVGRTQRARAFGYFVLGQTLHNLAAAYDSAAIVTPDVPSDVIPGLSGYADVNAAAIRMLDSALAATTLGAADAANFALPGTWLSNAGTSNADFARLIRSMRARVRVGAARTPAEATAIDWAAVIADGTTGITADFTNSVGGTTGWTAGYHAIQSYVASTWAWAPMYYYGMADVSGAYASWLGTNRDDRAQFLVVTPDTRWPQGADRATQQAEAPASTGTLLPAGRYMRNRPTGEDPPATGWGQSMYDHRRWGFIREASNTGILVEMDVDEPRLLAAEGYIRTGQFALAAPLIDQSRTAHGLPAIGIVDGTSPVAGGASCVPQVPTAPTFTVTSCGNMFEALKYEIRMETAWTGYMQWFRHHRRWGDMIEGTPLEWPVPYQEMQARLQPFYDGALIAPTGTYQFGNGANK